MPTMIIPKKNIISEDEETITIQLPDIPKTGKRKIDYSKVEAARGILKGKADKLLAHVKRLRQEWE